MRDESTRELKCACYFGIAGSILWTLSIFIGQLDFIGGWDNIVGRFALTSYGISAMLVADAIIFPKDPPSPILIGFGILAFCRAFGV